MKNFLVTMTLLLAAAFSLQANSMNKVTICHNYGEISVAEPAVPAHLAHGDIVKEEGIPCPERPASKPDEDEEDEGSEPVDAVSVVVIMRCEAQDEGIAVVSISASADLEGIGGESGDCPATLASLIDEGLDLRSATGGSADSESGLRLFTDFVLVGSLAADSE